MSESNDRHPDENPGMRQDRMDARMQEDGRLEDAGARALSEALRSSLIIVKILMAVIVVVFLASGFFMVRPNEKAVVLRFGRPLGTTQEEQLLEPGPHWAFPYPIDEVVRIPMNQTHTIRSSVGWYAVSPEMEAAGRKPSPMPYLRPGVDGYTITADENIVHVRATFNYRITDRGALNYKFRFTGITNILEDMVDNSILLASAQFAADDIIFRNKSEFTRLVNELVQDQIRKHELGVVVESSEVETSPPLIINAAFNEVLNAQQEHSRIVNEAMSYARNITNTAVGEARAVMNSGISHSNQVVQAVASEAKYFLDQLPYYKTNSKLFKERLLINASETVMTNAQDIFYVPVGKDGKSRELRIQLSREPLDRKAKTGQD
ncbi:MAG: protease modulator HflK [Verrucomicrobia bacterium]|nr:protease modulator HflK [Verrucomicrobiota bacterium]MCF7708736.1 protease modulator HflK [Verrucomicrobiota bacterium]